jgi:FkbM family methyltransferase
MLIPFEKLFKRHGGKPVGVLHLGANTGQEADAYKACGVNQVIWVEAIPEVYRHLVSHTAGFPGSIALQACVSDRTGEKVKFHIANNGGQSSSLLEFGTHLQEHPSVRYVREIELTTVRVDTLLEENNLTISGGWFLNIDLQGAELLALIGMGELLWQFDFAYIEVNEKELYKGCPLVKEIDDYLGRYGLIGVETKMTNFGWGDRFYVRSSVCNQS